MTVTVLVASRRWPPADISSYDLADTVSGNRWADRADRAAVRVVLPWSMWPIVPTLRNGLARSTTVPGGCCLAMTRVSVWSRQEAVGSRQETPPPHLCLLPTAC